MARYEVYATRWDDPHIVEELIPARDLEFTMPLCDDGTISFTATVEPGRSFWRAAVALPFSGFLVARDGQPVWQGWAKMESPSGPRSFQFTGGEWGSIFDTFVPEGRNWRAPSNDHQIMRDLVMEAQALPGQDVKVTVDPTTTGAATSSKVIRATEDTTVAREIRSISDASGGPEWYFGSAGTLDNPVRQLVIGDRLGQVAPETTLEYVEDGPDYEPPTGLPMVQLLGDLFPGTPPLVPGQRQGGNVIAMGRSQDVANSAVKFRALGSGVDDAQLVETASSATLLAAGWPGMTQTGSFDVITGSALYRHAIAELNARRGIPTNYSLVTLDGEPDWTQVPRGSSVQVILDTDVFGSERPVGGPNGFTSRLLDVAVRVPNSGAAQVEWRVATVLEV